MKKIIFIGLTLFANFVNAQNTNLESFKSKFKVVANKSTAWNSLIDSLKPTNSLTYYKLTQVAVMKDPCMQIAQQGASCPQVDYYNYFKRAMGNDTIVTNDGYKFVQEYNFETNSRPGNDILTNIDTIRYASFSWKLTPKNMEISKNKLRKIYLRLYNDIGLSISNLYGTPIEESSSNSNVIVRKYWTYRGIGTALGRIALIWDKTEKEYRIVFSGNIHKED